MARLIGLIGNRADLAGGLLRAEREGLDVATEGVPHGWGIGFYQGGEVLIRRRPVDDRATLNLAEIAEDVKSDVVIGQVRRATVGGVRTENTHPFRYRQWVFAQTGTVSEFEKARDRIRNNIPQFLTRSIRGDTDAELVFHVFLSFLHDRGVLDELVVSPKVIVEALRSTVAFVDGIAAEVGGSSSALNVLVSNGDHIVALRAGGPMSVAELAGREHAERALQDAAAARRSATELEQMHFTFVVADGEFSGRPGFRDVPDRTICVLSRSQTPSIEPI